MKHFRARKRRRQAERAAQITLALAAVAVAINLLQPAPQPETETSEASNAKVDKDGYALVWADEFDREGAPDSTRWTFESGTDRESARCEFGLLVIEARLPAKPNLPVGTPARLSTRGKYLWKHGRFEMRARFDARPSSRPLFQLRPVSSNETGEIDILHLAQMPSAAKERGWASQFHTWRLDWDDASIQVFVDGQRVPSAESNAQSSLPQVLEGAKFLREPCGILLGLEAGAAAGRSELPARFEVDYVRVFQKPKQVAASRG